MQSRSLFREPAQARRLLLTLVLTAPPRRSPPASRSRSIGRSPQRRPSGSASRRPARRRRVQDDQPVLLFDPELGYMTVEPVVPAAPAATPAPAKAANRSAPTF